MEFEIRKMRTVAQGRRQLVREREEYFRLMDQGLSSREACRRVGINYRTGKRWRNGRNPSGRTKGAPRLSGRPRKTLDWETPAERLHKLLAA